MIKILEIQFVLKTPDNTTFNGSTSGQLVPLNLPSYKIARDQLDMGKRDHSIDDGFIKGERKPMHIVVNVHKLFTFNLEN